MQHRSKDSGFTNPVLVSSEGEIIAGHGRVEAARLLGWKVVPTIVLEHLSPAERRAYVLADNKLALNAGWNREILAIELQALVDLQFHVELTGFSLSEVDLHIDDARETALTGTDGPEDLLTLPVSNTGDFWEIGRHRLICGDTRRPADLDLPMACERAHIVFTDPPYNVKIDGNVCGLGTARHHKCAFASGEMSRAQFVTSLFETLSNMPRVMRDGAIAFVCMDWRHMGELLEAGERCCAELKNLVIWNKTNGGMGTFYRSMHELVFVFKKGVAVQTYTFGLGETGRYRTNVWDYAGISSIGVSRSEDLAMHPTVKPVALIADAFRDCSRRGEIVLDGFGGSGSTLIAAEKTSRQVRLVECYRLYCDTIVRRWQAYTGKHATLASTGARFEDVVDQRPHATPLFTRIEPIPRLTLVRFLIRAADCPRYRRVRDRENGPASAVNPIAARLRLALLVRYALADDSYHPRLSILTGGQAAIDGMLIAGLPDPRHVGAVALGGKRSHVLMNMAGQQYDRAGCVVDIPFERALFAMRWPLLSRISQTTEA